MSDPVPGTWFGFNLVPTNDIRPDLLILRDPDGNEIARMELEEPCPKPTTPDPIPSASADTRSEATHAIQNRTVSPASSEMPSGVNAPATDLPALLAKLREARSEEIDAAERGWEDSRLTARTISLRHAVDALLAAYDAQRGRKEAT